MPRVYHPCHNPLAHTILPVTEPDPQFDLAFAASVLKEEAGAVETLASDLQTRLAAPFAEACRIIDAATTRDGAVLVSGLGKSGLIGSKISATLASLGITSHAVHPAEAAHGDLGRFRTSDAALCLSFSGETEEVVSLAAVLASDGLPVIAITGGTDADPPSALERLATVTLRLGFATEAGGGGYVAPTSSTTATLALGDALALTVARARSFTAEDFAKRHPGGALGGLLRPVGEILRFTVGDNVPLIDEATPVIEAQRAAAEIDRRPGALLVTAPDGTLAGIFTDGDLRRLVLRDTAELQRPIAEVMTRAPRTLEHTALVRDAVQLVRTGRQDEVPIVDDAGKPVGILDVQDLVNLKVMRSKDHA